MKAEEIRQAADVLADLVSQGITLSVEGDALRLHARKGAVTAGLRSMLLSQKQALIELLRESQEGHANGGSVVRPKLERAPDQDNRSSPLSFAQRRLWFLDQLQPESKMYTIAVAVRLVGTPQIARLERSLHEVVCRHESLHTTFAMEGQEPVQIIAPAERKAQVPFVPVKIDDLVDLPKQERERQLRDLIRQEAEKPFDLRRGPLLRATLLRLSEEEQVFLLTLHHIIADGWSLGILLHELIEFYCADEEGRPACVEELTIQYTDYVRWQQRYLTADLLQTQVAYWQKQLANAPAMLHFPLDYPRSALQTFRGATYPVHLSASLTTALKELSQHEGVTLFMTLLASFQVLLSRYSRQEDIVVGTPIANRTHAETEILIGLFVNMLALRTDLGGNPPFSELLERVRHVTQEAYANQDVPFEQVVEILQPERALSHHPLFQVVLVLQKAPFREVEFSSVKLFPFHVENGSTKFDITLSLEEGSADIVGVFEYNTDLFDETTIASLAAHWQILLQGIVTNPHHCLADLPLFDEAEHQRLLHHLNATQTAFDATRCIHELFDLHAEKAPDALAVVSAGQHITYRTLRIRANHLAAYLRQLGVKPEVPVAICLDRSINLIVGLLGILKAGGAYISLDPTYPRERLAFMVEQSGAPILLTGTTLASELFATTSHFSGSRVVCLDTLNLTTSRESEGASITSQDEMYSPVLPEHLAYVIYTSGSTGIPKGVMVTRRNLMNLVFWHQHTFHLAPTDRTAHLAGLGFDASVWEIWPTLLAGASLHLPEETLRMQPEKLRDWLISTGITLTFLPTPLAELLLTLPWPASLPLRTMLTGGDLLHKAPPAGLPFTLVNNYGPTECTVVATSGEVLPEASESAHHTSRAPSIGRPIANTHIYLLDEYLQLVPMGVPGEVYIGGEGVARGYWGDPALTAERFVPDIMSRRRGARLYRTEDLGCYQANGELTFLGRIDQQVKIRGYRIELGEIEAVLGRNEAIRQVVVRVCEGKSGGQRLIAYLVPHTTERVPDDNELRQYARAFLPEQMVPSEWIVLSEIPVTAHGKVDYRALPDPTEARPALENPFIAPRDIWEQQMVSLWEAVLGKHPIGVRDTFWALGGHSLLAVELLNQAQTCFGHSLPLTAFFQEATVEHLARLLRESALARNETSSSSAVQWSPLIPLQPQGKKRPLFCVHGVDGTVQGYRHLAASLGLDQPLYGLQAWGIEEGQEPLTDIATIASRYLAAVRTRQQEGPYRLGGWSFGGLIAFEMAQQLVAQHQAVELIVLFDTWIAPVIGEVARPDQKLAGPVFREAPLAQEQREAFIQETLAGSYLEEGDEQRMADLQRMFHNLSESEPALTQRFSRLVHAHEQANNQYVPQVYSGRVLLFTCDQHDDDQLRPLSDWARIVAGTLIVQRVPGNHYSLLREPHVQKPSEYLRSWLC